MYGRPGSTVTPLQFSWGGGGGGGGGEHRCVHRQNIVAEICTIALLLKCPFG